MTLSDSEAITLPEHGALSEEAALVAARLPLLLDRDQGRRGESPRFETTEQIKIIEK